MSEVLEVWNTVLYYEQLIKGYVCWRCRKWCLWLYTTLHAEYCYSCQRCQRCIVLCIQWPLTLSGGKAICYSTAFEKPSVLGVKHFTTSQSEEATLLTFLDLSTTRVIAGKRHSQSPILKTKGALSNLVILTYLWEQSCILHTLTKLPAWCMNFDLKSVFKAWRMWACIIPLE